MFQLVEAFDSGDGEIGAAAYEEFNYNLTSDNPLADQADNYTVVQNYVNSLTAYINPNGVANPLPLTAPSGSGNVLTGIKRKRLGPAVWKITTVFRAPSAQRLTGDSCFSFSTGGGSQLIKSARAVVGTPLMSPAGTALSATGGIPDLGGAINASKSDGKWTVAGIEIGIPAQEFKTTFYLPAGLITTAYMDLLEQSTWSVNSDKVAFTVDGLSRSYNAGELLFKGCEGSKRAGIEDYELSLNWAANRNVTNLPVGGGANKIVVPSKRGWDYLDEIFDDTVDGSSGTVVPTLLAVYLYQVYPYNPLSGCFLPAYSGALPFV